MLKQRVMTALVLLVVLGSAVALTGPAGFGVLVGAILVLGSWEWGGWLTSSASWGWRVLYAVLLLGALMGAAVWVGWPDTVSPRPARDILGAGGLWWALALLWVMTYPGSARLWGNPWVLGVMGGLVLVPCWTALVYLRQLEAGLGWVFYLVAMVCSADIGAYFAGRAWGRRKLAPAVSPGKSWAGVVGGLAAVTLLAGLVGTLAGPVLMPAAFLVPVSLVAALASVLGDLTESMIKRHRQVKDSSRLLPGHGGVLDRLDSLSAALPVFTLLLLLLTEAP